MFSKSPGEIRHYYHLLDTAISCGPGEGPIVSEPFSHSQEWSHYLDQETASS